MELVTDEVIKLSEDSKTKNIIIFVNFERKTPIVEYYTKENFKKFSAFNTIIQGEKKDFQKLTVSTVEGWPEDIDWNEKINFEEKDCQKLTVSTVEGWPEDIDWE